VTDHTLLIFVFLSQLDVTPKHVTCMDTVNGIIHSITFLWFLCFFDRASWYDTCKQPTWRTNFHVRLFIFSICFGQPCAHHQENYCINAKSGLCHSV